MNKGIIYVQWLAAAALIALWTVLVWNQVKGADDLIGCIKAALGAFGLYCWHTQATNQGAYLANAGAANGGGPGSAQPFQQPPQ